MDKQVTSTPPQIPGNGGGGSGYLYLHYWSPIYWEPAINVDMVNVMTIIIDHKKQRFHDDGAVYFMHSMAPCIL